MLVDQPIGPDERVDDAACQRADCSASRDGGSTCGITSAFVIEVHERREAGADCCADDHAVQNRVVHTVSNLTDIRFGPAPNAATDVEAEFPGNDRRELSSGHGSRGVQHRQVGTRCQKSSRLLERLDRFLAIYRRWPHDNDHTERRHGKQPAHIKGGDVSTFHARRLPYPGATSTPAPPSESGLRCGSRHGSTIIAAENPPPIADLPGTGLQSSSGQGARCRHPAFCHILDRFGAVPGVVQIQSALFAEVAELADAPA